MEFTIVDKCIFVCMIIVIFFELCNLLNAKVSLLLEKKKLYQEYESSLRFIKYYIEKFLEKRDIK